MSLDEYETVRDNPTHFTIAPDAERIVEKHEFYGWSRKCGMRLRSRKSATFAKTSAARS
jgi:hypothetical protein